MPFSQGSSPPRDGTHISYASCIGRWVLYLRHHLGSPPNIYIVWASLVSQMVKNLPAIQETQVRSLGQEDPLEKEMATHSSILAWKIPWVEEPGGLQSMGSQRVEHD